MADDLTARIKKLEQDLAERQAECDRLGSMLEKSNNQAHTFYNISKVIAATNDLQAMIPEIIGYISKSINFERVSFYLIDERREKLKLRYAKGLPVADAVSICIGEGLAGRIVELGEHSHVHDLAIFYETFNDFIHLPSPGYIRTEMVMAIKPQILEKVVETIPVKRLGTPDEIGSIVPWLAGDDSGFTTGADFSCNGGLHMG